MGRKLILPEDFKSHDFLKIMRTMKHARNRIRLLAMHHIQLGKSLKNVANSPYAKIANWGEML